MVSHRVLLVVASAALVRVSSGQCPEFGSGFHVAGTNAVVSKLSVADLGQGSVLYVGGSFTTAGPAAARFVATWDGAEWSALGSGLGSAPQAMAVFDGGGGPLLHVGGAFAQAGGISTIGLATWDGAQWSAFGSLPPQSSVSTLIVHDDGSGPALFVAGRFDSVAGVPADDIARWDGTSWTVLPSLGWMAIDGAVEFDAGGGPELYVAGRTQQAALIARWDGSGWTPLATSSLAGMVRALAVHDDGSGPALYAAGVFSSLGGIAARHVARFDGAGWSEVGTGFAELVRALAVFDDGSGAKLYAATEEAGFLEVWNGASWQTLPQAPDYVPYSLAVFDDGSGPSLWAGGDFGHVGALPVSHFAAWDGSAWRVPAGHANGVVGGAVTALEALEDSGGAALYAGGTFLSAGAAASRSIARFDGSSWTPLGAGIPGLVLDVATFDSGAGLEVYACGNFQEAGGVSARNIARWNGTTWSPLGNGLFQSGGAEGRALAVFDDGNGPALFAAGIFQNAGGVPSRGVARWDGTSWSAVGIASGWIDDLLVFDDGSGPALFAVGTFEPVAGLGTMRIAKWDGTSWSALPSQLGQGAIRDAEVIDLGAGPALYVAGAFSIVQPYETWAVAKWDGSAWTGVAGMPLQEVLAIDSYDDGTGPALVVSAQLFPSAEFVVARWNGLEWSALADDFASPPGQLESFDDGLAPAGSLYLGGVFQQVGGRVSSRIARWNDPCACGGQSYCTSGTTTNGCAPRMTATGHASASASSPFVLTATDLEGDKSGHLFYGLSGPHAAPWGLSTHFLCVKAPTQRTGTQATGGTSGSCDGEMALDWNAYHATHPGALGSPFSAGAQVWVQAYFRDPPSPKTTALTDGLRFTLCP